MGDPLVSQMRGGWGEGARGRRRLHSTCWLGTSLIALFAIAPTHGSAAAPVERAITAAERDHWAYRPYIAPVVPIVQETDWTANPVDAFIKAKFELESLDPMPRVGKATYLRRLSFDLTGLPPTRDDIERFVDDPSPDANDRLVDRLLTSPDYAERYAQHWLDLARYAETDGFEHDLVRPNAWRYRDWVIDALNRDMTYDQFVRMQIAGDEIEADNPAAAVATGFLLCGPDMPDINNQDERRHFVLNEMTSTVGSVFLGLQFGCAQCHDHKFDPITLHDFYRLRAFFESSELFQDHPIPTMDELRARRAAEESLAPDIKAKFDRRRNLERLGQERLRERNPDELPTPARILGELNDKERKEHGLLTKALDKSVRMPALPLGRVMRDSPPRTAFLYLRGDFRAKGPSLSPGYPRILEPQTANPSIEIQRPRAVLANWLTRPDHPLTTRVIANRIWQWHFGAGLSHTPSDFGKMGEPPTHPELLDWLAASLTREGWSLKRLHRLLATSETYQMASDAFDSQWSRETLQRARAIWDSSNERDPDNVSLWRRRRLRQDAESLRDSMLSAARLLSTRRSGESICPPLPREVTETLLKDQWPVNGDAEDHHRRGIYLFVRRNLRYPMFDVFDRPDTNVSCPMRHESTTPPQALVLFHSQFSLQCAQALADDLLHTYPEDPVACAEDAYLRILGRRPDDAERAQAAAFLQGHAPSVIPAQARIQAGSPRKSDHSLADLCLALFNSNEFVYLD